MLGNPLYTFKAFCINNSWDAALDKLILILSKVSGPFCKFLIGAFAIPKNCDIKSCSNLLSLYDFAFFLKLTWISLANSIFLMSSNNPNFCACLNCLPVAPKNSWLPWSLTVLIISWYFL